MRPNGFEIARVRAYAGRESGAGLALESASAMEAEVRPLNSERPGCVTIALGDGRGDVPIVGVDIARGVAVEIAYAMGAHLAADTPATIVGVAGNVRVRRADGSEYFSADDIGFQIYGSGRRGEWYIYLERRGPGKTVEASLALHFDGQNALMLAELLRTMPFR